MKEPPSNGRLVKVSSVIIREGGATNSGAQRDTMP